MHYVLVKLAGVMLDAEACFVGGPQLVVLQLCSLNLMTAKQWLFMQALPHDNGKNRKFGV